MEWQEEEFDDDLRDATRKFLPQTVVWTTDWTTGSLVEQMQRDVFDVDPPFQRRTVWSNRKSSLYIESLLLGCPVPPITLAEMPKGPFQYIVIDGKQRLAALKRFAIDRTLKLEGLETLADLNRLTYLDVVQRSEFQRFANSPIRTVVMRNWQKDEVLQFVFHRLNTQVTPLSTHELRRSLLSGPFTNYLDVRSAESSGVKRILNIREPDYRLRDAELLLRAIAFSGFLHRYRGNLKVFLDVTTRSLNKGWSPVLESRLDEAFEEIDAAIEATYAIFDSNAFQRFEDGRFTGRFNRAIFDLMVLAFRDPEVRARSAEEGAAVREALITLMQVPDFNRFTQATTKSRDAVLGRIHFWADALAGAIKLPDLYERMRKSSLEVHD